MSVSPEIPMYLRIREDLLHAMRLDPAGSIPAERALCQKYNVCRPTIHKALEYFTENNLIVRLPGKGSFFAGKRSALPTEVKLVIRHDWRRWEGDLFFGQVIQGLYAELSGAGISLSIEQCSHELMRRLPELPQTCSIWLAPEHDEIAALQSLAACGRQVIAVNRTIEDKMVTSVSIDHHAAGMLAAKFARDCQTPQVVYFSYTSDAALQQKREAGLLAGLGDGVRYESVKIDFDAPHIEVMRQYFDPQNTVMILNSMSLWDDACRVFGPSLERTLVFVDTAEFLPGNPCRIFGSPVRLGQAAGHMATQLERAVSPQLVEPVRLK